MLLAITLLVASSPGVSKAGWTTLTVAGAVARTGNVDLAVTDVATAFATCASESSGCDATPVKEAFTVANTGSIPSTPYISLNPATTDGLVDCAPYGITLSVVGRTESIFDGTLCDVLDVQIALTPRLDPGESETVEMRLVFIGPMPMPGEGVEIHETLQVDVAFVQWNSGPPGGPDSVGWSALHSWDVDLVVVLMPDSGPTSQDDAAASNDTPAEEPQSVSLEENPGTADEPTIQENDLGAAPEEASPPDDAPAPKQQAQDPLPPERPGEESVSGTTRASLEGYVWSDLDGDHTTTFGGDEPGMGGVVVILYDESGVEVARAVTDDGGYGFSDLDAGTYLVAFEAPDGYQFRDLIDGHSNGENFLGDTLATDGGPNVAGIIVDDIAESVMETERGLWVGRTAPIAVGVGNIVGPADAALIQSLTDDVPPTDTQGEGSTGDNAGGVGEQP